jgi:hypothetical protein
VDTGQPIASDRKTAQQIVAELSSRIEDRLVQITTLK